MPVDWLPSPVVAAWEPVEGSSALAAVLWLTLAAASLVLALALPEAFELPVSSAALLVTWSARPYSLLEVPLALALFRVLCFLRMDLLASHP
eukprot:4070880-Amphidinium_carterae.2